MNGGNTNGERAKSGLQQSPRITERPSAREAEKRLFANLRGTKLPMAPEPEASSTPPVATKLNSQPSFADGSPLLLELKKELLAKGMSDAEVEDFLSQLQSKPTDP